MKKEIKIIVIIMLILIISFTLWFVLLRDETVIIAGEEYSVRHTAELDVIPTSRKDIDGISRLRNLEKLRVIDAENVFPEYENAEDLLEAIGGLEKLRDLELGFIPINEQSLNFLKDSVRA
jgi:hypothetical protein